MHPRTQRALEALPPAERAAAEAAITQSLARRATPDGQAEEEEVIRKVREEFPPVAIDPELAKALSALRGARAAGLEPVRCLETDRHRPCDALNARDRQGDEPHVWHTPGPGPRPQQAFVVVTGR